MELRELRSFCTAAGLRSISKAADQLGIGQPAVTTHIKKLEEELGRRLFDRVRRPIQLTLSGRTLAEVATPMVRDIDALAISTLEVEERGPVTVGSTQDIAPHTLLRVVRVFLHRYPRVRLRIRSGTRTQVLRMVEDGEADLGIIQHAERGDQFNFEALFLYERVLITPRDHPLLVESLQSLAQIAPWPLIMMSRGTYTRSILEEQFQRIGIKYEIIVELDSMDMVKRFVALGMGVSVGPRLAIDPADHRELGIVSLANLLPVDQAGIVTLPGKTLSTPTEHFISVMRDALAPAGARRGHAKENFSIAYPR